ncbi:hypothetical protein [Guyparkeria sp.]|uniref:hypothetical protein n=1 Tax=Guyparkeria sp. TaxID=2035736 RepID=UPI003566EC38
MGPAPLEVLRVAARLAAESPGQDMRRVLEKAARQAGQSLDRRFLAADLERLEIETRQYQATFRPEQRDMLRSLREAALDAMSFFGRFRPRLVGEVLSGTADDHSPIVLQLFAATPEEVIDLLVTRDIPFEESETTYQYGDGRSERCSVFELGAQGQHFRLEVFAEDDIREAPLASAGGGTIRRASARAVRELLDTAGE